MGLWGWPMDHRGKGVELVGYRSYGSDSEGHFFARAVAFRGSVDVDGLVLVLAPIGIKGSEGLTAALTGITSRSYLGTCGLLPKSAETFHNTKKRR